MTTPEARALGLLATLTDADQVRSLARKAKHQYPELERAALRKLVELESSAVTGTVEADCWAMVLGVEEIRRHVRGRKSPMNRLRPKIAKDGERAALEYLALNESDGFREVLDYGLPHLTAEAIVIRWGEPTFTVAALKAARQRLLAAGLDPEQVVARRAT